MKAILRRKLPVLSYPFHDLDLSPSVMFKYNRFKYLPPENSKDVNNQCGCSPYIYFHINLKLRKIANIKLVLWGKHFYVNVLWKFIYGNLILSNASRRTVRGNERDGGFGRERGYTDVPR